MGFVVAFWDFSSEGCCLSSFLSLRASYNLLTTKQRSLVIALLAVMAPLVSDLSVSHILLLRRSWFSDDSNKRYIAIAVGSLSLSSLLLFIFGSHFAFVDGIIAIILVLVRAYAISSPPPSFPNL